MTAQVAWKYLNGLFCVYKPAGISLHKVRSNILHKLCRDLNELDSRPPVNHVTFVENSVKDITIKVQPSYADNTLVVGPRYQEQDFRLTWAAPLGINTSGVLGINDGLQKASYLRKQNLIRVHHVNFVLGQATDTAFVDRKIIAKASYDHVTRGIVDRVLASFQAAHQKQMFLQSGVDIQTQAAYDLAVQDIVQPTATSDIPVLYSLKCLEFDPPNLTIEVHSINAMDDYMYLLVREIGRKLRTLAVCTGIRCIKHGPYTIKDSLLRKHWTLEHVVDNILHLQNSITPHGQQDKSVYSYDSVITNKERSISE